VRVDRDGGLAECGVQDDVGGLAPNARQRLERGPGGGNLAAVARDQRLAGGDEVLCLAVEEADGLDVRTPNASMAAGEFAARNRAGVALLTLLSVACADRITATNSSNGERYSSSVRGAGFARWSRAKSSRRFAAFMG
jgi:hypothetical protein